MQLNMNSGSSIFRMYTSGIDPVGVTDYEH
jgi:hypothetical protein